jgi:hypothetical protein
VRKYEDRVQSLEEETTTLRENLQHIGRELSDVSAPSTHVHILFTSDSQPGNLLNVTCFGLEWGR